VSEDLTVLQADVVAPMRESVTRLESANVNLTKKNDKLVKAVKMLLARVQGLNESMEEVKTDLVMVRTEQVVRFSTPGPTPGEATDELMDFIMSDEKSVAASAHSEPPVSAVTPSKSSSDEEEADDSVMSLLTKLVRDVKVLQSNKQTTCIRLPVWDLLTLVSARPGSRRTSTDISTG
jgi:hypothetical protein